jgi:hypothetical protein
MKLFGRDVTAQKLMNVVKVRLEARGLSLPSEDVGLDEGVEPAVEPFAFAVDAMSQHVDATRGLPIETHRDGLQGRVVVLAKRAFRAAGQLFINEALARQVSFNGHVLDAYAQLSAEVLRLRTRVAELEAAQWEAAKQPLLSVAARPVAAKAKKPSRPAKKPR